MGAPFGVHRAGEDKNRLLNLGASGEPREEGLIAGVAVLAPLLEFSEDRLLGFLSSCLRFGSHWPLPFGPDRSQEPIH